MFLCLVACIVICAAYGQNQNTQPKIEKAMDFLELTKQRYSERYFDSNKSVEQEKLDRILEAGRQAPTAANLQPQRFYVIKSSEAYQKAQSACYSSLYRAPVVILVCYDLKKTWHNRGETLVKTMVDGFTENPQYNSGEQDCAIATTQMMYAAEEQGIHTIWIRGFDARAVQEVFKLPKNIIPALMLPIGYPSDQSKPAGMHFQRMPIEDFVTEL